MRRQARILVFASALWALGLGIGPALSDDESATAGDIQIEGVAATPAKAGETTRITFTVENGGTERAAITGLRLPSGEPSRVLGFLGTSHSAPIGAIPIGPGERYRLDGRTAWIDVGPLKSDLKAGAVIDGKLVLGRFEAPISIHVTPLTSQPKRDLQTGSIPQAKR